MIRKVFFWALVFFAVVELVSMIAGWYGITIASVVLMVTVYEIEVWTRDSQRTTLFVRRFIRSVICPTGHHPFLMRQSHNDTFVLYCSGCNFDMGAFQYAEKKDKKSPMLFIQRLPK